MKHKTQKSKSQEKYSSSCVINNAEKVPIQSLGEVRLQPSKDVNQLRSNMALFLGASALSSSGSLSDAALDYVLSKMVDLASRTCSIEQIEDCFINAFNRSGGSRSSFVFCFSHELYLQIKEVNRQKRLTVDQFVEWRAGLE